MADKKKTSGGSSKRKVAVVGGGVAGLAAAWHLKQNAKEKYEVHLFEAEDRLGGHAHTVNVDGVDVDIGFMVFNHDNYPNMVKWFEALGVDDENSDMSLSVSLDHGETVEWNSDGINGMFAKQSQAFSPAFYTFIREMLRFNAESVELLQLHQDDPRRFVTIGQYLRDHGYSETFSSYYLLPMIAAVWSMGIEDVLKFPAAPLISFFCNHKMLQIFQRPQWKTVAGRSQSYTLKMKELLGPNAHVASPIISAKKQTGFGYELFTVGNKPVGIFDEVIFACHPPTAAKILEGDDDAAAATPELVDLLTKIEYADNAVYVHSDPNLMPTRRSAWASWNCIGRSDVLSVQKFKPTNKGEAMEGGESGFGHHLQNSKQEGNGSANGHRNGHSNGHSDTDGNYEKPLEGKDGRMKAVYVTYWLNRLQNLKTEKEIFVSLNPHEKPQPSLTHQRVILAHPQFNAATLRARQKLEDLYQGKNGLWFCGAWACHGFHEDGCRSGFEIATKLSKIPLPWCDSSVMVVPEPDLSKVKAAKGVLAAISRLYKKATYDGPVWICRQLMYSFLRKAIRKGELKLKFNDGSTVSFGDGSHGVYDKHPVTLRVFEPWFFVKTALEYDLGLARSYMAGHFVVEPLPHPSQYDPTIRDPGAREETTPMLGDPLGLLRFFLLIIGNRDDSTSCHVPRKSGQGYASVVTNASGLLLSHIGSMFNYLRYKLVMDNSEAGGSLKNIHAHYDLSNDLFTTFLDTETLIYSSAIYDAVKAPGGRPGLVFRSSLEEAQVRKVRTLLDRAQIRHGQTVLDIGFGWGQLSIAAAKAYGCKVTGITLSVEQKALAEKRVKKEGLEHLISFEVVDYRTFARRPENLGRFDRVLCCEMIEAVGHNHLQEYFWAVEQLLNRDGILVMEAITTPEERYESYRRSADFINTIIFPGSCCPSLHALIEASYKGSSLTLEHIDNIGLHYAKTLQEWRQRFNAKEDVVRSMGFDDIFLRVWNYYMTYCEAGFVSQTENCLILVFARQGCRALAPLSETRCVTQAPPLTVTEIENWLDDGK